MLINCVINQLSTKNYMLSLAGHQFSYILILTNSQVKTTYGQCKQQQMAANINVAFNYYVPGTVLRTLHALSHLPLMILLLNIISKLILQMRKLQRS